MKKTPLVSIVIPCFNSEKYIAETLESMLAQDYPAKEIIVVDDGSTDHSLEIVQNFASRGVRCIHQENAGGCAARNRGFRESTGDYIQFFDADDLMSPDKISAQITALERCGDPDAVATCAWRRFDRTPGDCSPPGGASFASFRDPVEAVLTGITPGNGYIVGPCFLTPRHIIDAAGLWDKALRINQDGEFFMRVTLHASQTVFVPQVCVHYRDVPTGSVSKSKGHRAVESFFRVAGSYEKELLARENSLRVRRGLTWLFTETAYLASEYGSDVFDRACEKAVSFGCRPRLYTSRLAELLTGILPLRTFLQCRRYLKKIGGGRSS